MQKRRFELIPGAQNGVTGFLLGVTNALHAPSLIGPAITRASAGARMTRGGLSCSEGLVFGCSLVGVF